MKYPTLLWAAYYPNGTLITSTIKDFHYECFNELERLTGSAEYAMQRGYTIEAVHVQQVSNLKTKAKK